MNTTRLLYCLLFLVVPSVSGAYTLTFDDFSPGYSFWKPYLSMYQVEFGGQFAVADHSSSSWGPPHSGQNVLVSPFWDYRAPISFRGLYGPPMYTHSFSAYFSTEMDTVLRIDAYDFSQQNLLATAQVGATGEAWNNHYVEIAPPGGGIYWVYIVSVSSYDALQHFSLDDLTVDPVPEPCSLAALALGLAPLAAAGIRRRR